MILSHKKLLLKKEKSTYLKCTYGYSGNDYRVATLSKSYLTTSGINMFEIDRTVLTCLN